MNAERLQQLFDAIDRMDADGFVAFLTPSACFRFGNAPTVRGREAIHQAVAAFFASIQGIDHRVLGQWQCGDVLICHGEASYTRADDSRLDVPFANILRMQGHLIDEYLIFVDASAL